VVSYDALVIERSDHPETAGGWPAARDRGMAVASQWRLMWWRFRRHRLALAGAGVVSAISLVAIFGEFLAPTVPDASDARYTYAPPQSVHLDGDGLYVNGYRSYVDQESLRRVFTVDGTIRHRVGLFARGEPYRLLGVIPWDRHLVGPVDPGAPFFLLGADHLGRDVLSRLVYGTRVSMSIGLVGVLLSLVLGIVLGGVSGYYGGRMDMLIQRLIEFLRSVPHIPLWLGLAAALPPAWPALGVYFAIIVILALIGWTELARVVRGKFLSLREEDFVTAALLDGSSKPRIMFRHMLPSFASHLIASLTLSIPAMILGETALSFLGLGLRPPVVSWGVLLQEAQNIRAVATAPWLLTPALAVVVSVLALNFLGDGLRDSADPYAR
jgi:peptide/nickel transport system permease protein